MHSVIHMATELMKANINLRWGQALFNALHSQNPGLANKIRATEIDPFYDDDKIGPFLIFIEHNKQ